jgi:hypothetical protein
MGRPSSPDAATGVREILIEKLSGHVRETYDPRWVLVPVEKWPDPMPPYVDSTADMYDDLVAGLAVRSVPSWRFPHGMRPQPQSCYSFDIAVDGTVTPSPRDRIQQRAAL